MEVRGKIIIVTGGALEIVRALCRRFVSNGAQAVIAAMEGAPLKKQPQQKAL